MLKEEPPVQTELPTGVITKSTVNWCTGATVPNAAYYVSSYIDNTLQGTIYYDSLGRNLLTVSKNLDGTDINIKTTYNSKGQVDKVTDPYKSGGAITETKYYYDVYGRPDYEYYKNDLSIDYDYSEDLERCVTITNKRSNPNQVTKKRIDAMGNVRYAIDAGGTITYKYASSGGPKEILAPGSTVGIVYDEYGRQQTLTDPDAGTYGYGYNAFGEQVSETDNMGRTFNMQYDELGRLVYKDWSYYGGQTIYEYGTSGNEKGRLKKVTAPNGYSYESYTYDEPGNIITSTNYIESGKSLTTTYEYNNYGELTKTTYPSGFSVKNTYNNLHYQTEVRRGDNNALIWKSGTMNAMGQWDNYTLGDNLLMREFGYDAYNLPQSIKTKKIITGQYIQNLGYLFDNTTGNLTWRRDNNRSLTEAFVYDNLNRLTETRLNGTLTNTITYDNAKTGNINSTTLAGDYKYEGAKPHAITKLDNANPGYPGQSQTVSYTNFDKVSAINNALGSVSIIYGAHNQRVKMSKSVSGVNSTVYYDGGYEEHIKGSETRKLHYIAGGDGLCAIYEIKNGTGKMHYVLTDHLGSYDKIYDDNCALTEEYSFDAWGRRRNPTNWTYTGTWTTNFTSRGFTGHEHIDGFDVINMNGRCYDPYIGRFLSPDNFVQMPDFTQNFNRYAYCFNNPLKYTDPSGYWAGWDDLIVGGLGFAYGYVSYGLINDDWGWRAVAAGGISAGTFLLGYYSGGATSAGSIANGFSSAGLQSHANTVGLAFAGKAVAAGAVSSAMPSMTVPVGENSSISVSPGIAFGPNGIVGGINYSYTYNDGTTAFSAGGGITGNSSSWGFSAMHNGYGGSYYQTRYGDATGPDGISNNQLVGGIGLHFGSVSFRIENDAFGDHNDRWRSNAYELSIGKFVFGSNLYNNDVGDGEIDYEGGMLSNNKCNRPLRDGTPLGAWKNGLTYNSPLWVGYRDGNNIMRWGYSHPLAQDRTQNVVHRWVSFGRTNFFNNYSQFQRGSYVYGGYYNPYSLW